MTDDEKKTGACPLLGGCCFFNDICENMPASSEYLKNSYCRSEHEKCARYHVYQNTRGEGVPSYLFPSDMERTAKVIRQYGRYQGGD